LKLILRKAYHIIDTSTRPQERISAMSLSVDIYGKLMDLSTNSTILEKTLKWLESKNKTLGEEEQRPIKKEEIIEEEEEQEQKDSVKESEE
jgi:hypothetical protein